MTRAVVIGILTVWTLGWGSVNHAAAQTGDATEKLLKEAKLEYKKVKDGVFKLVIETKQGISVVIIEEKKASWKDNKKNDVLYAYIYTEVLSTPTDFKPPTGMLSKIAEWNDRIRFGSLGLSKSSDGSYTLFRNGTIFLKNLEGEQLEDMVFLTHNDKFLFAKEFRGFLDGGQ
jgi:hypothetical protein